MTGHTVPIQSLNAILHEGDKDILTAFIDTLDNQKKARCIDMLEGERRTLFAKAFYTHALKKKDYVAIADVISLLDPQVQADVIHDLGVRAVAKVLHHLETDDILAILENLKEESRTTALEHIPTSMRAWLEVSLSYPKKSAGRLMQREVVAVPVTWHVGDIIDYMRQEKDLPHHFFDVQVVDPRQHPVGVIRLATLLRSNRDQPLSKIMETNITPISIHTPQEEVAFLFRDKDLTSYPVVDEHGRLAGVVTIDDVVDVIDHEAAEDFMHLASVQQEGFHSSLRSSMGHRFKWLAIHLGSAFLSAFVIAQFADSIDKLVALAVLMPVVASMGGIAAVQTLTVTVRAIAMKELVSGNRWRNIVKECVMNCGNGLLLGCLAAMMAWFWYGDSDLALVTFVAIVMNIAMAGALGTLVPLLMERVRVDPAIASATIVTMGTDVFGFLVFLALGTIYVTM